MHQKTLRGQVAYTYQKSHRARPAAESRGFRIQVEDFLRVPAARARYPGSMSRTISMGQFPGTGNRIQGQNTAIVPAIPEHRLRLYRRGGTAGAIHGAELIPQIQGHAISSFSSTLAVALPSVPISPTGPAQEGHP